MLYFIVSTVGTGVLPDATIPGVPAISSSVIPTPSVALVGGGTTKSLEDILKVMPQALVAFIGHLPAVEGPSPAVDIVLSILMQSNIPGGQVGKLGTSSQQLASGPAPATSDLSSSRPNPSGSSLKPTKGNSRKRKEFNSK
ncbi:hypothetical protein GIB67_010457 [Kingdonia uniflora]|uniref:Uncharacterized protein n=1 Tax=Kingdonia uniflora TaxID=39325 RepID=A0A7J7MAG6_9MAGN|nr:hypothetical protein GIB67_010457 [Kingdonia uniflora]